MLNSLSSYQISEIFKSTPEIKVFKGFHIVFQKYFVLKLVHEVDPSPNSNYNLDIEHENIVKCYSKSNVLYEERNYVMYVLEYVNGGDFNLNKKNFIKDPIPIFKSIIEGISYLHSKNIIHGDLKPSNILISVNEGKLTPKISDYDTRFINSNKIAITPEYSPPEWRNGVGRQTDVWSFGCLLHEFFTGKLPFGSIRDGYSNETIIKNIEILKLDSDFLNIEEPYRFIIYKSLIKDLENRYKNVDDIIESLKYSPKNLYKRFYYFRTYLKAVYKGEIRLN